MCRLPTGEPTTDVPGGPPPLYYPTLQDEPWESWEEGVSEETGVSLI